MATKQIGETLSISEAAERLRLSRQAISRRLADGRLASTPDRRIPASALAAYLASSQTAGAAGEKVEPATPTPVLYNLEEVAQITGLPLRSLQNGARAGRFLHIRSGGRRWMTAEHIRLMLSASEVAVTPSADDVALAKTRARFARRQARQQRRQQ